MTALPKIHSSEEYLILERIAEGKSEFHDGKIIQRTSSNIDHITLMMNVAFECRRKLKDKKARVLMCDMKVRTADFRYFLYPDILIYSGKPDFHDEEKDVILNPHIVFEIVSEETSAFDRGDKFHIYQKLESLKEYILVDQTRVAVEHYNNQNGFWKYKSFTSIADKVSLSTIDISLELNQIYNLVEFEETAENL